MRDYGCNVGHMIAHSAETSTYRKCDSCCFLRIGTFHTFLHSICWSLTTNNKTRSAAITEKANRTAFV